MNGERERAQKEERVRWSERERRKTLGAGISSFSPFSLLFLPLSPSYSLSLSSAWKNMLIALSQLERKERRLF